MEESPFYFLEVLKHVKDIPHHSRVLPPGDLPQSVSDHTYQMAFMCWMMPDVDEQTRKRAVYMALVHDIGAAIEGDVTSNKKINQEDKKIRQELALQYLKILLAPVNQRAADEAETLWLEFQKGETDVSKWVRDMGMLENAHQAMIDEQITGKMEVFGFFQDQLKLKIEHPKTQLWAEQLLQEWEALRSRRDTDMLVFFVIGGPGVGKGTQCAKAALEFDFVHISIGDLLRDESQSPDSPYRDFINKSIKHSVIIPAGLTVSLLVKKMNEARAKGKIKFLLDGFPRSVEQAIEFERKVFNKHTTLSFHCSAEAMQKRLRERAETSGRIDDNFASILKRLETFQETNKSVEDHLRQSGFIHPVSCDGSISEVYTRVQCLMREINHKASTFH